MSKSESESVPRRPIARLIADGIDWRVGVEGKPSGNIEAYFAMRRLGTQGLGRFAKSLYPKKESVPWICFEHKRS
jgi:hypothetical protein